MWLLETICSGIATPHRPREKFLDPSEQIHIRPNKYFICPNKYNVFVLRNPYLSEQKAKQSEQILSCSNK